MRRHAVVAGIALLFATTAHAQGRGPIRFGVLAGANLSSVSDIDQDLDPGLGNALLENQRRGGAQAALYATIPISSRFSLQPELHYTQKGGKASFSVEGDPESLALLAADRMTLGLRLSYVEIPVLARMDRGSGNWRPFVMAGPSLALRTSCKASTSFDDLSISGNCNAESVLPDEEGPTTGEDPFNKTDVSAIGGVGIAGAVMGRAFSAQLRYSQGLTTIARETTPGVSPKNRGFSLVLGLGF
jgi:Outer membrane protein beta-barrel domain